jgi:hypothetical protein
MSHETNKEADQKYYATRVADRWKAKKLEYQERHKATLCKINLASLVVTLGLAGYTYLTVAGDESGGCDHSGIMGVLVALYFCLVMHATNITQ